MDRFTISGNGPGQREEQQAFNAAIRVSTPRPKRQWREDTLALLAWTFVIGVVLASATAASFLVWYTWQARHSINASEKAGAR